MFKEWVSVLINPRSTFQKEKYNANATEAAKMIAVAGIIAGITYTVGFTFFDFPIPFFDSHGFGEKILYIIVMALFTPLYAIVQVFMLSAVLHIAAKFFGHKGNLTAQTYLIALFASPLMVIYMSAVILPHGMIIAVITVFYFLYLLTLALKEIHR